LGKAEKGKTSWERTNRKGGAADKQGIAKKRRNRKVRTSQFGQTAALAKRTEMAA